MQTIKQILSMFLIFGVLVFLIYFIIFKEDKANNNNTLSEVANFTDSTTNVSNFLGGFAALFDRNDKEAKVEINNNTSTTTENKLNNKIEKLTQNKILNFHIKYSNEQDGDTIIYTLKNSGHIFALQITDTAQKTNISRATTLDAVQAKFVGDDYIVFLIKNNFLYKLVIKNIYKGNLLLEENNVISFDSINDNIYFVVLESGTPVIYNFNIKNKQKIKIAQILQKDVKILATTNKVFVYSKPSHEGFGILKQIYPEEKVILFNKKDLALQKISKNEFLYSYKKDKTFKLQFKDYIIDGLSVKCSNAINENMFCFIPEKLNISLHDYFIGKIHTKDYLYKINLKTGLRELVFPTLKDKYVPIDAKSVIINKQGNKVYFINKYDEALYMVDISD